MLKRKDNFWIPVLTGSFGIFFVIIVGIIVLEDVSTEIKLCENNTGEVSYRPSLSFSNKTLNCSQLVNITEVRSMRGYGLK